MALSPTSEAARPADLPALRALHAANWRRDYAGLMPEAVIGAPMEAYLDHRWSSLTTDGMHLRVVREGKDLAGFVVFFDRAEDGLFIENLHVAAEARGRGVGRALIETVAHLADHRPVCLEVLDGNLSARAIYRHWGGDEGAARKVPLFGDYVVERPVAWPSGGSLLAALKRATT